MLISQKAAPPAKPSRRGRLKPVTAVAMLLVVVAAFFGIREGIRLMRTAVVLSRASPMPLPLRVFLKLQRTSVTSTHTTIQSGNHVIPVHVYSPLHVAHPPVIVLVHGFAPQGYENGYLDFLAVRLALVGFRAVVPNIHTEQFLETRFQSVQDIGDTVHWSAQQAHAPVALFGVSFGGGLAIATAENPVYAPDVKMVFDLSGYDNLQRIGLYYIHEKVFAPSGRPYPDDPPISGSLLVAYQHLDEMVPLAQVASLRAAILSLAAADNQRDLATAQAALTPDQRQVLQKLLDFNSPVMHDRYVKAIDAHAREYAAISPDGKFNQLHCPLYVLHGTTDATIPVGEAEWMRKQIPRGADAHFLLSPDLGHAMVKASATRWDKLRILYFMTGVLNAVRR